ncbi:MAG TPA: diguanylate cyclase [Smithellaceae bacterium]|nr:diguanylate cyclase [Smithellaceae bacterium]HRV44515.1 diguanylate cyclase [Smithellaceae bacterium]
MILRPRTNPRSWPFILCLILWWALAAQAREAPPVRVGGAVPAVEIARHAEYLLDYSNRLQVQDIIGGGPSFQRHTKYSFQFSFKRATLWFKCRIAPADAGDDVSPAGRRSLLVFDNAALGAITLYVPVIQEGKPDLIEFHGGWRQGNKSREFPFLYPTFVLPDNLDASRPVVARVATPYALQFRATLYTVDAFRKNSFVLFLIVGLFAGILIAMILYNLALYLFIRDRQYLFYITYVGFLLLWQCILIGLFRYLWPPLGEFLMSGIAVFAALMMIFAVQFGIVFLNTPKTAPRHDKLLKGLAVFMGTIIVLVFLRQLWLGNLLSYLSGQVVSVVLFTAAFSSLRSGFRPALFYLIAFGVFLLAAFVFFFKFYGLIPNNTFTMHIVIFGSAAEAILLSFALGYRIRIMQEEEEQLRERERNLEAISVTDELTGLFNRRFLNPTLVKKTAAARRTGTRLSLLMMDVDHFKDFNDTYGHPEGDKVLAALGRLLVQTLREEDIACRYGGEEFVVILHNADLRAALEAAERIRAGFEKIPFQPGAKKQIHATISIGAAELLPNESPEEFLNRADQAMYQAKQTGRNRICRA